jgi:hypothetical protein
MFFLKLIVFQLLIQYMSCECGEPGLPFGGSISGYKPHSISSIINYYWSYGERLEIIYSCSYGTIPFYDMNRHCIKGKWTGRVPKCGKYLNHSKL